MSFFYILDKLFSHFKTMVEYLMNIFNCSLYEINQGEKMRIQSEGLLLPAKTKHIRTKLNKDKVEHFL